MREIKFRAWDKIGKKMSSSFTLYEIAEDDLDEDSIAWTTKFYNEDRFVIMQYTGLKDKNGKEIYAGDIVKWGHNINTLGDSMGVCFDGGFEEGQGEVTITPLGVCFGKSKMLWDSLEYLKNSIEENIEEIEVIGDIYENEEE